MKVLITKNRDKEKGVVNSTIGYVQSLHNHTPFVKSDHLLIPIFPVTNLQNQTYYPITLGYSTTILCKAQGQTLSHATLFFDSPSLSCGCSYVAMSRVRSFSQIRFLQLPRSSHFQPRSSETQT